MSVTFQGEALFSSGPHRLLESRRGRLVLGPNAFGNGAYFALDAAVREAEVIVEGRLVSATVAGLWPLLASIRDKAEASETGELSWAGRVWSSMTLVEVRTDEPVSRGRVASVGYRARFLEFLG